jgi:ribose 5-phosphate isomerase B
MDHSIFIASDHAGFELKQYLISVFNTQYEVIDCGPKTINQHDDYPDYAKIVCENILEHDGRGILICDTGIGMSIAANRYEDIRAAMVTTEFMAERSREHNNANILCLGQDLMSHIENEKLTRIFLTTSFSEQERHIRRLQKIDELGYAE